jgi:hypothetical protein
VNYIHTALVLAAPPPAAKPDLPSPSGGSIFLVSFLLFVIVLTVGAVLELVRVRELNDPKPTAKKIVTLVLVGTALAAILAAGVAGIFMTLMWISSMAVAV